MPGVIISAPTSGSGKTIITLGILRALARMGVAVRGAKSGPDYIDPRFLEAACGKQCMNLDAWAMSPDRIKTLAATEEFLIVEGAMGLFDGAPPDGKGATADLARILGLPVVLVVNSGRMAQSIAPLVLGFANHDPMVKIAGVVLNHCGSIRHENMLRKALNDRGIKVLGTVARNSDLTQPSRHLGLVQAQERPDLDAFLDTVADVVEDCIDLAAIQQLAKPLPTPRDPVRLSPPAQKLAVANDQAFAFSYPHILADWQNMGAEILFFSPLNDEAPPPADRIFLPGGYPELYAGKISNNQNFIQNIKNAALDTVIYGECGGYMTLGERLIDADGRSHQMAGLLPLETSFADRKLHLGYRKLSAIYGPFQGTYMGHEFHYATTLRADGTPLFAAQDAEGTQLAPMGLAKGNVYGSFAHIIDRDHGS